jgi:hypothetical protein
VDGVCSSLQQPPFYILSRVHVDSQKRGENEYAYSVVRRCPGFFVKWWAFLKRRMTDAAPSAYWTVIHLLSQIPAIDD